MHESEGDTHHSDPVKYPWLGPLIFFSTLVAVVIFFVWFVRK